MQDGAEALGVSIGLLNYLQFLHLNVGYSRTILFIFIFFFRLDEIKSMKKVLNY